MIIKCKYKIVENAFCYFKSYIILYHFISVLLLQYREKDQNHKISLCLLKLIKLLGSSLGNLYNKYSILSKDIRFTSVK